MNFMDVIKQRYSCRNFTDRPVSAEDIETILAVGGNAPSAPEPMTLCSLRSLPTRLCWINFV